MILPDNLQRRKNESDINYKVRLCVAKLNKEIDLDWIEINQILGLTQSSDHTRKLAYGYKEVYDNNPDFFESDYIAPPSSLSYKENVELLSDGSHKSDKLIAMSQEQSKDKNYLLKAHGYNSSEWEIVSAKSSIWNQHNKKDGTLTMYSSKITVKPSDKGFDFDKLIDSIMENQKPAKEISFNGQKDTEIKNLNIPLFDLHFGNNSFKDYEDTLKKILRILNDNTYNETLIIVGQDLLHNDNFRGQTASGTVIEKVDMVTAWDSAKLFYNYIIDKALERSEKVSIVYSKGNHDESISWAFVKALEAEYMKSENADRMSFDTTFEERKVHMLDKVFIGTTHGDKARNNLSSNFSVEFPEYWAKSTTREVYIGHLHRKRVTKKPVELVNDSNGLIVRELGTGNKIDSYHRDNGYTMAHKEFEIFEYTAEKKSKIYYV